MDFTLTDEQEALQGLARQILTDRATLVRLKELDGSEDWFDRDTWAELAKANVLGVAVPEAHGGLGYGFLELCLVLQEQGRRVLPLPLWSTLVCGALPVAEHGTEEQQGRILPAVARGELVMTGAFEELGAPPEQPVTTATRVDGGWRLDGEKTAVPMAHVAGLVLLAARTESGKVGLFLVDPRAPGVTLDRQETTSHEPRFVLRLDAVQVGDDALLGGSTATGAAALRWTLDRAVTGLCAISAGAAQEAIRIAAEYVTNRKQFDRPLATFQAVGQRMADSYIDTEAITLTMLCAATHLAEGQESSAEVATAKYWAAEGGSRVGFAVLHVHGGVSIDVDYPIHRYFLWLKQDEFTLGAATPQLLRLGRLLAEVPA